MEEELYDWVMEELKRTNKMIPRSVIKNKARKLTTTTQDFKASKGWLDKFFKRYNLPEKFKLLLEHESIDYESNDMKAENIDKSNNLLEKEEEKIIVKQGSEQHVVFVEEKEMGFSFEKDENFTKFEENIIEESK